MKAVQLNYSNHHLAVVDIPTPNAAQNEIRIQVKAAGVCLSDVHLIDGTISPFMNIGKVTLGHEVAGVIDQIGSGVTHLELGQRVLLHAGEVRDGTVWTRGVDYDGGWAEYAVARADTVVPIPDNLPFEQACFIPDAVSTPWAAISRTAQVKPAQTVGVWGIGGLGFHGVQLLRMIGAAPIIAIDPLASVKERASAAGADYFFTPDEAEAQIAEITQGAGVDVAFDFAGVTPVREQALRCLSKGGKLILVGLSGKPITIEDSTKFSYLRQEIIGHYGSEGSQPLIELVKFIKYTRLDFSASVSGTFSLDEASKAVQALKDKTGNPIRLILKP